MQRQKNRSGKVTTYMIKPVKPRVVDTVQIGSIVIIRDCETEEKYRYEIVASTNQVRFTTMGYRKKDYAEITQVSDADGEKTISDSSDLGKALIGRIKGDIVSINIRDEWHRFEVLRVLNIK